MGAPNPTSRLAGLTRHGDLAYLFSSTGAVSDTRVYDLFGAQVAQTGSIDPHLGFQSDFTDPVSSRVWMGARWYQPATGSFASRDTLAGLLGTPVSLNRYTYAFADPLGFADPDGRWPFSGFFSGLWRGVTTIVTAPFRWGSTSTSTPVSTATSQVSPVDLLRGQEPPTLCPSHHRRLASRGDRPGLR